LKHFSSKGCGEMQKKYGEKKVLCSCLIMNLTTTDCIKIQNSPVTTSNRIKKATKRKSFMVGKNKNLSQTVDVSREVVKFSGIFRIQGG
jgi:hypothetical protein